MHAVRYPLPSSVLDLINFIFVAARMGFHCVEGNWGLMLFSI
uniref:Uncharacterized protein n=1 Tax=Nelumbo nucifera TaxID=4432 RepID=A0A822ZDY4_NELNU|nr:TPA_asm: hypothetical protein HUJ06_000940 [Nelumbo nucifera]